MMSLLKTELLIQNYSYGQQDVTTPFLSGNQAELQDRMTMHRDKFLVNKTNTHTEFQFYWYYDSTCIGQPSCPSSGVLSHKSALVHFMQFVDCLPGSKRSTNCIKCTNADVWLRTPDDGQEGSPKHLES
jgi:hypothetical protein